ncbi:MAG: Assimilatory nitrate reductase electron transfer subunit [candidate division WS2 bacterium]|uniref:Assimilatory nitrate reductase electron transfer subunit n=1 Tax=Psychracetigena formicireducens TaxID=2986056 RepID=A0A9E2BJ28_PSYF1|nr:Assimilatory nitrate reductase electron transfer subunit [Candidatus Psychracetigena formicireducens]
MKIVIIGNGTAGITAASTIKKRSPSASLTLITEEIYPYYPRPNLIEYMAGRIKLNELFVRNFDWYGKMGISLLNKNRVIQVNFAEKEILLESGGVIIYDTLLIASGSKPNIPRVPGVEWVKVFTLGNLESCFSLREKAGKEGEVLIIGGGILGLEIAKALKDTSVEKVTVLEQSDYLLSRQLDKQGGELLGERFQNMGIKVVYTAKTKEMVPLDSGSKVILEDGREFITPVVIACIGTSPEMKFLRSSGLQLNRGVVVDRYLKTNIPDVFAAGDVAEFEGKTWGIMPAAFEQGEIAGLSILGEEVEYRGTIPSNRLKVAGINLFSMGTVNPLPDDKCTTLIKYEEAKGVYKKAVFDETSRLIGVILLGSAKGANQMIRLIKESKNCLQYGQDILEDDFDFEAIY